MGTNLTKAAPDESQDTQEALDYLWKSITFFGCRCFNLQYLVKSFQLLTEVKETEKFDDVILEYTNYQNDKKYILAQAKHTKTAGVLDSNSLIADENLSMVKYFASFWAISRKFNVNKIENVMIITNNTLAGSRSARIGDSLAMQIEQTSESLYLEKTDHFIFEKIGEIYRFVDHQRPDKRDKLLDTVKILVLSYKLASLCIKKPKTDFLFLNQRYLFDTIVDKDSLTLKQMFLAGTLTGQDFFYQTFQQALKVAGDKKWSTLDKIARIHKQFPNIFNQSIEYQELKVNQVKADCAIDEFLNKLLFVTKLETEDLQVEIHSQLREIFKWENIDGISAKVERSLKTWFMNRHNKELRIGDFENFITEIATPKLINLRDETFWDMLQFKSILPDAKDFLCRNNPNLRRILHLQTTEDEIPFAAMRVQSNFSEGLLYLKTSYSVEDFEQLVIFFEKFSCYKLLIIEIYKDTFQVYNFLETYMESILQNNPSKKLVLIGEVNLTINLPNIERLTEKESYFTDLTVGSQSQILDEKIRFQDRETTWRAALDGLDLNEVPLKDVVATKQLGGKIKISKTYGEKIYIPRTILYNNCLKPTILQRNDQQSNDVFHYDEDDFEKQRYNQTPHHLLQRSGNQLEWIGSTRDLSIILKHIDESNPKCSTEEELLKSPHRITIVSNVAGMGKSLLLYKLAEIYKEEHPDFWVYKLDLNDHSESFDDLKRNRPYSSGKAIKFLGEKIMKFKSDFEKKHFTNSCIGTGKVILLIDGVDEIFSSYGEEVVNLIKLLSQTKIKKLFIATRPVCCERLEKEFLHITHSLQPFSESDQMKYLLDFLRDRRQHSDLIESDLQEIVEAFMESMRRSIRAKDYKHTGVPLVTKLAAQYLECCTSQASCSLLYETVDDLKTDSFSLWSLYETFITKSFIIYFTEKCGMDPKNPVKYAEMRKKEKKILENYKIYAIQEFLKKDATKFFPNLAEKKFTDFEIEEMVKVGLIYKTDNGYKFVHQTIVENLFTLHLMKNFDQPKVAQFIVHSVLIDEKFQIIRSFIDDWIEEKMTAPIYDVYYRILLSEGPVEHTTPIHVSGKEQNSKIIDFIYNCLTRNSKFDHEKSKVQKYLFETKKSGWKVPAIFYLITWSENLHQILDSVRKDFGQKFVHEIFNHGFKSGNDHWNLLLYNSRYGENLPNILKWLRTNFQNDQEFLEKQIFSVCKLNRGIFHQLFWYLSNTTISNLFNELENWKKDLIRRLISTKDQNQQVSLLFYADNKNFGTDCLIEFLRRLRGYFENDDSFLTEFVYRVNEWNRTFLHNFCVWLKNFDLQKFLKWFHEDFGHHNLEKLLLLRDVSQDSIIFNYFSNEHNSILDGLEILNYLKVVCKFDESFLRNEVILLKSSFDGNVLQQFFLRSVDLDQFNDFIEGFKVTDAELKLSFIGAETFIFHLAQKSEENQEKFVNFLKRKFGGNFMNDLISNKTLYNICWNSSLFDDFAASVLKFFDFVERNFNTDLLKSLICFKGPEHKTFLFPLQHVVDTCLMKILNYLFEKFKDQKNVLAELLLSVNDYGNTFLIIYFLLTSISQLIEISRDLFESIKLNFGLDFLKRLLLTKNKQSRNFLHVLLCNKTIDAVEKSLQILEILLEVIGKDKEFFIELIRQEKIPDRIKEFMERNFKIRRKRYCHLM